MADKAKEKKIEAKSVIQSVRMTEKAVLSSESRGVYCLNVDKDATKAQVVAGVKQKYKVTPLKIRLLAVPAEKVFVRGKWGVKAGGKKAYVYLKKGDKIEA